MARNIFMAAVRATIPSGQTVSGAIDCGEGGYLCGVQLPAGFEGSALTLTVSADGVTFTTLRDESGAYQPAAAASAAISLDPAIMLPWRYVKISGGAAQGAERTLIGIVRQQ